MADYKSPGVYVEHVPSGSAPIAGAGTSTAGFVGVVPNSVNGTDVAKVGEVKLITNFTEFKAAFGDFSSNAPQRTLAHAVYGYFQNGGTRCYVTRVAPPASGDADIAPALELFEPIDEIAIVAAPGLFGAEQWSALTAHCEKLGTCVAVLDTKETFDDFKKELEKPAGAPSPNLPQTSSYGALYFPWILVANPGGSPIFVPPSGHIAGVYSRTDTQRGVHKAPANETILGALDVKYMVSRSVQDGLNPHGVNCIRFTNGSIKIWGARTVGGDANTEFKYLNVRRLFNFLRQSLDQGTQWAVFEPNGPDLWARITRNVTDFLTRVWGSGGLVGDTPEQAFFVKCDAETNPPALRDLGQVVTEVGVAISRPAEFVIFRLGQKAAS